jgi:hypothetical protein
MPEVILKFQVPEEGEELRMALDAGAMYSALWDIAQEVFRPARKHGYSDPEILNYLINSTEDAEELIYLLEKKFYDILRDKNISL